MVSRDPLDPSILDIVSHLARLCLFLVAHQVAAPLTTPEEAQAFLASMRDKQKAHQVAAPPAHLSRDGMDAWYSQQKKREQELKKRRKEAESLLRGYRSSYVPGKEKKDDPSLRTISLSEKATSLAKVGEAMADPDSDIYEQQPTLGIQRLTIDDTLIDFDTSETPTGGETAEKKSTFSPEASVDPAVRQKSAPAHDMPTEWRDFVEPGA
jgi:hypothetical protein